MTGVPPVEPTAVVQVNVQEKPPASQGRYVENGLAIAGGFVLCLYPLVESATRLGLSIGPCQHVDSFPWGQLIAGTILVMPKTIGRASSGRVWEKIGSILPGGRKDA